MRQLQLITTHHDEICAQVLQFLRDNRRRNAIRLVRVAAIRRTQMMFAAETLWLLIYQQIATEISRCLRLITMIYPHRMILQNAYYNIGTVPLARRRRMLPQLPPFQTAITQITLTTITLIPVIINPTRKSSSSATLR